MPAPQPHAPAVLAAVVHTSRHVDQEATSSESLLVDTQMAEDLSPHAMAQALGAGTQFTSGGLRVVARRFIDAATLPKLQLVSAGVTMRKEEAFAQPAPLCMLVGSASYGQPRPVNEDAYFIASAYPSFMTYDDLQPGLRGIIGHGGTNAAGIADGVGGYWVDHGISAGKASAEMARICSESLGRGATLAEAIAVGHSRLVDPLYVPSDGCTTFAAYQVRERLMHNQFAVGSGFSACLHKVPRLFTRARSCEAQP